MNIIKENSTSLLPKLIGETRHYPPAVKEWGDSIYTYDKKLLRSLPSKDIMANKIIKGYLNLSDCKHLARSKRMRTYLRKLSANKIFLGKPELKQTNDNVAITIYTLDAERQILLRKIFHSIRMSEISRSIKGVAYRNKYKSYDDWRNKYTLNKSLSKLENNSLINTKAEQIKRKYMFLSLRNKHLFNISRTHFLKTKYNINALKRLRKNNFSLLPVKGKKSIIKKKNFPYFGSKFLSEAKFLRYISQFKNNSIQARKRVYYLYMKRILSLLGIKVLSFDGINGNIYKEKNEKIIKYLQDSSYLNNKDKILLYFDFKGEYPNKTEILHINSVQGNLPYIDKVNIVLSNFVKKILKNNNLIKTEKFSLAMFSKTNFSEFISKEDAQDLFSKNNLNFSVKTKLDVSTMKKEISLINEYINVKINNYKFGKYLPALKLLLSKIYNKNVQLNIIKLKYLYLNSDILMEVVLSRIKKSNYSLVMKKSLGLVKLPKEYNDKSNNVNIMKNLNVYNTLKLKDLFSSNIKNNNVDSLDLVLKNIYPLSLINQQKTNNIDNKENEHRKFGFISSKLTDIFNIIKYKWITGVRLEVAGRLTRRYTASRSIYKYKSKGNLKNTDFSRKLEFLKKSMPVVMLRNKAKTNSQYTFTKSKKRIGAFGLKGWISSL